VALPTWTAVPGWCAAALAAAVPDESRQGVAPLTTFDQLDNPIHRHRPMLVWNLATVSASVKRAEESRMARIIVETDPIAGEAPTIVMDEHVVPVHLAADPGASQFVERVAWALQDAEAERT
jgi:hypothetical protein